MPVTIKDIAKSLGVSHSTVSRALHGSRLISVETAERVRQAASELDYHPSAVARGLKTNSTRVLGVVVSSIDDPFFSEILQGIEDTAQEEGYSLFITSSQRSGGREQKILEALMEYRVDGVIICSTSFGLSRRRELLTNGRPIVVVNNQSAEEYRYSIYHDDLYGSRQVTSHLLDLGHRKIAYLGNALSGRTTIDRLAGLQQELDSAGIPLPDLWIYNVQGSDPETGRAAAAYFLGLPERPTAIFCYNDMLAIGLLRGLQELGARVPMDISIAGFDNITYSAFTNPPLTTFDQPKRFIGIEAARLLLGLLESTAGERIDEPRIHLLKGKLLVRNSTAAPTV